MVRKCTVLFVLFVVVLGSGSGCLPLTDEYWETEYERTGEYAYLTEIVTDVQSGGKGYSLVYFGNGKVLPIWNPIVTEKIAIGNTYAVKYPTSRSMYYASSYLKPEITLIEEDSNAT